MTGTDVEGFCVLLGVCVAVVLPELVVLVSALIVPSKIITKGAPPSTVRSTLVVPTSPLMAVLPGAFPWFPV